MTGQGHDEPTTTDATPPSLTVVGGNPGPAELAAVTAVLTGVLEELSQEHRRADGVGVSAWSRGRIAIRPQLTPGHGAWRSFAG